MLTSEQRALAMVVGILDAARASVERAKVAIPLGFDEHQGILDDLSERIWHVATDLDSWSHDDDPSTETHT